MWVLMRHCCMVPMVKLLLLSMMCVVNIAFAEGSAFITKVHYQTEEIIAARLGIPMSDVTVHYLGVANAHRCNGATHIKVDVPSQEDFRGKTLLYIEGWKDAAQCGRWTVQADIEIWGQLPTARYAVQAGDEIEVEWVRGRLDKVREPIFELTPNMTNVTLQAIVPISQGETLKRNHIRRKPDFQQGAPVVVLVQKGALQVRVQGNLLRNAYIGDTVKVRSQSSNSILEGQITESGIVLLK